MSDRHASSISREDTTRLEQSYKILAQLQRKTLSFLRALDEYEKRNRHRRRPDVSDGAGDKELSRIAFIVTPLMVNHYNHMHRVYRASMYGKVPDLCDQTGGIVCADFGSLREELAAHTTDVNRSMTTVFDASALPGVRFEFNKDRRDSVLETSLRLLDSINVKQPDLTNGIRDDYIQNVRAIQESLTSALEKSRERAADLQSRLDDASRKLKLCEKNMVSSTTGADRNRNSAATEDMLRREILKLKDTILEQQRRLLEQEVSFNERFVNLVQANEESELVRRLRDRLKQRFENDTEVMVRAREEISTYAEKEMEQMSANFNRIREDVIGYATRTLARSEKEREETQKLFSALLSSRDDQSGLRENGGAEKLSDQFLQLQSAYAELRMENDRLKKQQPPADVAASREHELVVTDLRKEIERLTALLDTAREQMRATVQEHEKLEERVEQLTQSNHRQEKDLYLFLEFLAVDVNVALAFGNHVHSNGLKLYSDVLQSRLIPYLESVLTDVRVKTYVHELQTVRAIEIVNNTGVAAEIERLRYLLMHYDTVIQELVKNMEKAYAELVEKFSIQPIREDSGVTLEGLSDFFKRLFGKHLLDSLLYTFAQLRSKYNDQINTIVLENQGLREKVEQSHVLIDTLSLEKERAVASVSAPVEAVVGSREEQTMAVLDGDPVVFDSILRRVYDRPSADALKKLLYHSYYACSLDNVVRYETTSSTDDELLKLYHLVDYDVLSNCIKENKRKRENQPGIPELGDHQNLEAPDCFLDFFLKQLGNAWVESCVSKKSLVDRNRLAMVLFKRYYIPVMNKESFVMSIEGPFANFSMVYKV